MANGYYQPTSGYLPAGYSPLPSSMSHYADWTPNPAYISTQTYKPSQQDLYNINLANYMSNLYSKQMSQDLAKGAARGAEVYGEGALGRLDPSQMQTLADRYQTQSLQGYSSPEYQAARERYLTDVNRQIQQGQQQSAQRAANLGVRGAAAAGLSRDQERQGYLARLGAERQAKLDDLGFRQQQQAAYGQELGRLQQAQQYNLEQRAKELQGKQAYEFGYGSLGAAQRAAAQKYVAGQQNIQAAQVGAPQSGGGK